MSLHSAPIVGVFHRQGGKAILSSLPLNAALRLQREPENPFDADAIKVLVDLGSVPEAERENLNLKLQGYGLCIEELEATDVWFHLGYIANSDKTGGKFASVLAPMMDQRSKQSDGPVWHEAKLGLSPEDKPLAVWEAQDAGVSSDAST